MWFLFRAIIISEEVVSAPGICFLHLLRSSAGTLFWKKVWGIGGIGWNNCSMMFCLFKFSSFSFIRKIEEPSLTWFVRHEPQREVLFLSYERLKNFLYHGSWDTNHSEKFFFFHTKGWRAFSNMVRETRTTAGIVSSNFSSFSFIRKIEELSLTWFVRHEPQRE